MELSTNRKDWELNKSPSADTDKAEPQACPLTATPVILSAYSKATEVFFFASDHEADYPKIARRINVKGGTYIGIIGGLEQNFAYWVANQPDKIVLYDINPWTVKLAKAKFEILLSCDSFSEFSDSIDNIFKGQRDFSFTSISPDDFSELVLAGIAVARMAILLTPRCDDNNGWSKAWQFNALKQIIASTTIELVCADVLAVDFINHQDVSLIFLSDILGLTANHERQPQMLESLRHHFLAGDIRKEAQIIDSEHPHKIMPFTDYIA